MIYRPSPPNCVAMIYPDNFESKIGFDLIRNAVSSRCNCSFSREEARKMKYSSDYENVSRKLRQTDEMLRLIVSGKPLHLSVGDDISPALTDLKSEGGYASPQRLLELLAMIRNADEVRRFFEGEDSSRHYPALAKIASRLALLDEVSSLIEGKITKYGEVKDNASETLYEIRGALRSANGSMQRAMRAVLDRAASEGVISRDATPAVRDGRMVIPVESSKKRSLKGIVHDASATGKTVFIEPMEVVEASNRIKELELDERHEVVRILKNMAELIRPMVPDLTDLAVTLGLLDFIAAKAEFARDVDGRMPHIHKERCIEWYHAVHPGLLLTLRAVGREVVALSLTLDDENRILIISGPNAGGKSVCLKTVGIVQYMMQCGLLPTVYENSHMGIFDNIYVDIGDEQSIENDLSTYSSHLKNMKFFVQHSSSRTLILADEMGSGTEPQIGGALAQAILARLKSTHCMGVVTTHYQNLKTFAAETPGFVNGAMLYDTQHLKPTFQLSVGTPGSSFALDIARNIGFDNGIIENAKEIVGSDYVNLDKYLSDIARDRRYWSNKRRNIKEKESKLDSLLATYEDKRDDLKATRNAILHQAKEEAREIVATANARIEKAIRDIRSVEAEKERTKEIRRELEAYKMTVEDDDSTQTDKELPVQLRQQRHQSRSRAAARKTDKQEKPKTEISVGDYVRMKDSSVTGQVMKIEGKRAEVAVGSLRTSVDLDKLVHSQKPKQASLPGGGSFTLSGGTSESARNRQLNFKQEIDVRGMRGDEAVQAVIYFLDDAVQFGASRLRILHGTGQGILKTLIRQQLDAYPAVRSYHDEDVRFGGAGITVVDL